MTTRKDVDDFNRRFHAAIAARDVELMVECFAPEGRFIAPDLPIVQGREALAAMFRGAIADGMRAIKNAVTHDLIESGNLLVEVGTELVEYELPAGERVEFAMKYVGVMRRRADGQLEILVDAVSPDRPDGP
jgi:ketosteroid isomerase-like protein